MQRARSLPSLPLPPAVPASPQTLSAPGSARRRSDTSSSVDASDVDSGSDEAPIGFHGQPVEDSLEERIQQIFWRTASEPSDTAPFTRAAALVTLVNDAVDAHDIRTLLAHIPATLLHGFVQLLRAASIKLAMLAPDRLGEMAERALEHTADTPQAATVWLVFSELLTNKALPIPAIHTLLDCMRGSRQSLPDNEHLRRLYEKGQQAVNSAMERRAPALLDAIGAITTPDQLRDLLAELTPAMLRFEPRLLLKLVPQLSNAAAQDPQLLGTAASACLSACTDTPVAEAVWLSLCEQLQSPGLSLQAARFLFIGLRDAARNLPSEEARMAYRQATACMNARNEEADAEARYLEQRHSTQFAHTRERSHSLPTLPSQQVRVL